MQPPNLSFGEGQMAIEGLWAGMNVVSEGGKMTSTKTFTDTVPTYTLFQEVPWKWFIRSIRTYSEHTQVHIQSTIRKIKGKGMGKKEWVQNLATYIANIATLMSSSCDMDLSSSRR